MRETNNQTTSLGSTFGCMKALADSPTTHRQTPSTCLRPQFWELADER